MGSSAPAAPRELSAGGSFAGFTIDRPLGRGAHGVVYAARGPDGAPVALKLLSPAALEDPDSVARFEREVRALQRVSHGLIARIVSSGIDPAGAPYLATELVAGASLRARVSRTSRMPPRAAWGLMRGVAEALAAAHGAGVVHRDVKPDNVMVTPAGEVRVIDFGLARVDATPTSPASPALTGLGAPLGTPDYMPPEQWWNDGVGPATDQYALAATLFELCAGTTVFQGDSFVALMQSHLSAAPPTFASAGVEVGPAGEAWLARALAKSPSARFESMDALRAAGDSAFGVDAPAAVARRSAWPRALGPLVVAALGVLAVGYAGTHDPRDWVLTSGRSIVPILGASLASSVICVISPRILPLWAVLTPAALGSLGAYLGLFVVMSRAPSYGPARHFEVFNLGLAEAYANRFVGLGCSIALLLAELAKTRVSELDSRARREALSVTATLGALALAALWARAPSAVFVSLAACASVALAGGPQGSFSVEFSRGLRALALSLCAVSLSLTRVDARAARVWSESPSRSMRAAEILAALGERHATLGLSAVAVAAVTAVVARKLRRSSGRGEWSLRTPATLAGIAVLTVYLSLDGAAARSISSHREDLWGRLAPRFALFSRLDPPPLGGRSLPVPTVGPCLQISRDTVALNGDAVGLLGALRDSEDARAVLSADLSHAMAAEGPDATLVVMVDRSVRWAVVRMALGRAWSVGARRVEVLLTRGPSPGLAAGAPPEASYALPRDFGALVLTLSPDRGARFDDARSMQEVVEALGPDQPVLWVDRR